MSDALEALSVTKLASPRQEESVAERLHRALRSSGVGTYSWEIQRDRVVFEGYPHPLFGDRFGIFEGSTADAYRAMHPEDRERVRAALDATVAKHRRWNMKYRVRWPNGETRWLIDRGQTYSDDGGAVVRMAGVQWDISDQVEIETALSRQRELLRQVIDTCPSMIYAKDLEGRFTLANRAAAELYHATIDDLIGKSDADFSHNRDELDAYRADDRRVAETRSELFIPEESYTAADGRVRWFQTVKTPLVDGSGNFEQILGVATDITARKEGEETRARLEESLRQAQKLESIGHLAGGIAHDFNNLLTPILGYAEMGVEALRPGDPIRTHFSEILAAAQSAVGLVKQLLAFGRKQVLDVQALDLNLELEHIGGILRRVIPENISIELDLEPKLGSVLADPTQLQQILVNLAVNARDAMPSGGQIRIATRRADAASGKGDDLVLSVSDDGVGIAPETLPMIFEPFFTTKTRGTGGGLGLSTVYGIVEQHGGSLRVESEPGKGTTFFIHLPSTAERGSTSFSDAPRLKFSPASAAVLVVEDDPRVRHFVVRALRAQGYRVYAAEGADQALRFARNESIDLDLLLTDVVMPRRDGKHLFRSLSKIRPDIRVLYMSGYSDDVLTEHGTLEPGVELLQKPFSHVELVARVQHSLRANA